MNLLATIPGPASIYQTKTHQQITKHSHKLSLSYMYVFSFFSIHKLKLEHLHNYVYQQMYDIRSFQQSSSFL